MIIYQCDRCKGQNKDSHYLRCVKLEGGTTMVGKTFNVCAICIRVIEAFLMNDESVITKEREKE